MDEIVVIDFLGEKFQFATDRKVENPERVVRHLEQYIKEAQGLFENRASERNKIAILLMAAMNISKDYYELKTKSSELEKTIEEKLVSINRKLEQGIK